MVAHPTHAKNKDRSHHGRYIRRKFGKDSKFQIRCPRCKWGFLERRQEHFNLFDCDFCDYVAFFDDDNNEFLAYKYAPWRPVPKIPKKGDDGYRAGYDVGSRIENTKCK